MKITGLDHIVLAVADVAQTCDFYERVLGMKVVEHRPGQMALVFGRQKISLQPADQLPALAVDTAPGSANFCLLTDTPMHEVLETLEAAGVAVLEGPGRRVGATGPLLSVYLHDPDGNLVEVANRLG